MKNRVLYFMFFLAVIYMYSFLNPYIVQAKTISLLSPENGKTVNITNKKVRKWWNNYKKYSSAKNDEREELTTPVPVTLRWDGIKGASYRVYVSRYSDVSKTKKYCPRKTYKNLKGLLREETYYWKVVGFKKGKKTVSKTYRFKTNDIARIIYVPKVDNVRDIGG